MSRLEVSLSTLLSKAHERSIALTLAPSAPSLTRPIVKALPGFLAALHALPHGQQREELEESWNRVRELLEQDDQGRELVRTAMLPYAASHPLHEPSSLTNVSYTDEPYRDDVVAPSQPEASRAQLYSVQQGEMAVQDGHLDQLSASIQRQRELGLRMGDELELHGQLLEEMNAAIDGTTNRLDRARGRLTTLETSLKQHASTYTIIFLVLALTLYIIFVK